MKIAVLLVTWNAQTHAKPFLESLLQQSCTPNLLQVVDNASTDDTVATIEAYQGLLKTRACDLAIERNRRNLGFTEAANQGLRAILADASRYEIVFLINQDTVLDANCLQAIQDTLCHYPDAGAVGCKIFYPGSLEIQHAGGFLERPRMIGKHYGHHQLDEPSYNTEREVDFVTGAALAVRCQALEQIGVFNAVFSPGYYEDVDLCVRLRAHGWRVVYSPCAVLSHVESASFTNWLERFILSQRNRLLFAAQYMSDPGFRSEFEEAELHFLRSEATPEDLRVLSQAYGYAMLALGPALRRLPDDIPLDDRTLVAAIDMIAKLRQVCLAFRREGQHYSYLPLASRLTFEINNSKYNKTISDIHAKS